MNEDVLSIDSLIEAMYQSMSFSPGSRPDYERFRSLFSPGANLLPPSDDDINVSAVSVDEFIETSKVTLDRSHHIAQNGFNEKEIHRVTHQYESVVQIFSTYECLVVVEDEEHRSRGINAVQLIWQSQRWWIVSLIWDDETPENLVPNTYLP